MNVHTVFGFISRSNNMTFNEIALQISYRLYIYIIYIHINVNCSSSSNSDSKKIIIITETDMKRRKGTSSIEFFTMTLFFSHFFEWCETDVLFCVCVCMFVRCFFLLSFNHAFKKSIYVSHSDTVSSFHFDCSGYRSVYQFRICVFYACHTNVHVFFSAFRPYLHIVCFYSFIYFCINLRSVSP